MEHPEGGQVRITCVDDLETLWPRAGEWNALVRANRTNTIFQTFEWYVSWCRAFGSDVRLLALLAESDAGLVGIAPLMLSKRPLLRRRRRVVEFIGSDSADYCDFILGRPDVLPHFLDWLADNAHLWDVLNLSNLTDTSPLLEVLPLHVAARGYPLDLEMLYECPTRILGDLVEDEKALKKKTVTRHENYFHRTGGLEFRRCANVGEIEEYLGTFFEQHVQRWTQAGFPSLFSDERQRIFYRHLVEILVPAGWVHFSVLLLDQKPIAFHFGFEYDDRLYWIKPAFDPSHAGHSPGAVLLKYSLADAMARGVKEFDFTVGEEPYKYRFANHVRRAHLARVYRHRIPYHLDHLLLSARARLRHLSARGTARGEEPRPPLKAVPGQPALAPPEGGPD